ncbi:MAG: ABC transporter substrate-binding protein [Cyanobacteria bacterium P01_F01_bin.53]
MPSKHFSSILKTLFQKRFNVLLAAVSTLLVLTFAACTVNGTQNNPSSGSVGDAGTMPTECRIGYQVLPNNEVLAKSLRLVEKKFPEVKIRWTPFPAGWKVNAAMKDGKLDIGLVGSLPVSTGLAQGLPFKVFVIHDIIGANSALAVTKASGIKVITDLPGKRIGVPFGSTSHYSLLSALEQNNINAQDVTIIDMSLSELIPRWNIGAIDGAFVWQPTLEKLLDADGNVLISAKELTEKGSVTADLGTVAHKFSAAYPNFVSGFVDVLGDATQIYRDDPEKAAKIIAAEIKLSPEVSLAIMNELIWLDASQQAEAQYMGTPEEPGAIAQVLQNSAEFMEGQNAIPNAPELETFQAALFHNLS